MLKQIDRHILINQFLGHVIQIKDRVKTDRHAQSNFSFVISLPFFLY
jgi:hypothetical protein